MVSAALEWVPEWLGTIAEAERLVPAYMPMPMIGPTEQYLALVEAVRAIIQQRLEAERDEEDDIEMLLATA